MMAHPLIRHIVFWLELVLTAANAAANDWEYRLNPYSWFADVSLANPSCLSIT